MHKQLSRRSVLKTLPLAAACSGAAVSKLLGQSLIQDTPTVTCAGSTSTTVTLTITAGPGIPGIRNPAAPNGYRITWDACSATLAGNFAAGVAVNVTIGASQANLTYDPTSCANGLACGTSFAFTVVARGVPGVSIDSHPANATCATSACVKGCTFTQGFWKNHADVWPVSSLKLGTVTYTKAQLLDILETPVRGNGLISLAHQLIAAKLNVANGASCPAATTAISAADLLIDGLVVPPVGSGSLDPSATSALVTTLDAFNSGTLAGCPTECK